MSSRGPRKHKAARPQGKHLTAAGIFDRIYRMNYTPFKPYTSEFTPEQTLNWLKKSWAERVKPFFGKFSTLLNSQKSIPPEYFSRHPSGSSAWTPLLLYLRPETVQSLFKCFKSVGKTGKGGSDKIYAIWDSVLHPYLLAWEDLLLSLADFYGDESIVHETAEAFHSLRYSSSIFQDAAPQRALTSFAAISDGEGEIGIDFDLANYKSEFEAFCKAYTRLPTTTRDAHIVTRSDQTIPLSVINAALDKATKLAATMKTKKKHGIYSQAKIAKLCGVSRATINRWETGPGAKNDKTNPTNRYGYYRELRINPDLYMALGKVIKVIKKYSVMPGRPKFVSYDEEFTGELKAAMGKYEESL